jgi:glucose-6-phosphate 1-dehydrogenase
MAYLRICETVFLEVYLQTSVRQKYQSVLLRRWSIIPFAINSGRGMDSSCRTAVVEQQMFRSQALSC